MPNIQPVMRFQLTEAIQILDRTPRVMESLLRGLPSDWLNARIQPGTFSPLDVLGHLIFGELTDWIPRARIILESTNARAFDPFDRRGFGSLIEGKPLDELLNQFAELRAKNIELLRTFQIDEAKLDLPGLHPSLGAVTMRQLLATWVVHDWNHIDQTLRVLSRQYGDQVGPWREYLSILS